MEQQRPPTAVYPNHWGCHITVTCKDGRVVEKEVTDASGSVDNPLNTAQIIAKATGLLREATGAGAPAMARQILEVGSTPVGSTPALPSLL